MDLQNSPLESRAGLTNRVKNLILTPSNEWDKIDTEASTLGGLYRNYVMILAAIPPLASLLHGLLFGHSILGITYRPSFFAAISTAIVTYILSLLSVFVLGMVIDTLAPTFGASKNRDQAFKVAAYTGTASWVAGIFSLIPGLGLLTILGLYSLYLLYLGLPKLMKAPPEKAMPYTVVTIIATVVLTLVAGALAAPVAKMFGGTPSLDSGDVSGTLSVPGVGSVDMGKLNSAAKQAEATAKGMQAGGAPATAPAALQALLPATLAGMARSKISSASAGAAGIGGSEAEARYEQGESNITLKLVDMAAMGALAGIGAALNVQKSEQSAEGYEKAGTVDGQMTIEKWSNGDKSGTYSVMIANRFLVEAEGRGTTMDALKSAVASISADQLDGLAR
jgi:hypothetical protein